MNEVVYKGIKYKSLPYLCKVLKLNYYTVHSRIYKLKLSLEDAINYQSKSASQPVTDHTGKTYPNKKEMAWAYGIDYHVLVQRLKYGWSLEKALTEKKSIQDHTGQTFSCKSEMARAYGLTPERLTYRLKAGWSLEDALTGKKIKMKELSQTIALRYNNKDFSSLKAIAKATGTPHCTLRYRIMKRGLTIEQAVNCCSRMGILSRDHLGNDYPSLAAMARAYKLTPERLTSRLNAGWSIKKALTTPVRHKK